MSSLAGRYLGTLLVSLLLLATVAPLVSRVEAQQSPERLDGVDDRWIESGSVRAATYANLPPGRYTFQVKAATNEGVWNEEGASVPVPIASAWWRTWWAYGLYGLMALGALYVLRRRELKRFRLESQLEMERLGSEKLRELGHARSRFFTNVSHEFRTPLTLTLGPLDDLRAGLYGSLSPAMMEQVELARRNAGRVLELINQILELARLEAGRTPLRARPIELGSLVRNVGQLFAPLAEREELVLEVRIPTEPVTLHADHEHLEKVLSNLLSNALKFTPRGGSIRVIVEAHGESARVAVRDSGPGIPAAELGRVFDRFHRVDRSSTRVQPGTGIGLALARELVELHGGTLGVESEKGFGSSFTVALPLGTAHLTADQIVVEGKSGEEPAKVPPPASSQPVTDHVASRSADGAGDLAAPQEAEGLEGRQGENGTAEEDITTVLIIEDNAEVRRYLRRHLTPAYRVLEAADGERGLEVARTRLPDLILSDVMMPGMDGHALCRALKEDPETDFIPIVLLTARAAAEDRMAGLRERADDYLTKPFHVPELLARIENLIASRKRLRERFTVAPLTLHPSAVGVKPADERFLEQVRTAIEEHLGDETFSVERLAREVSHSRGYLHRRLRALVDETPSALIRRMRLERAAQLVEGGAGSIGTIAYAVGFKSVAHFSNSFQEHFSVRPSGYAAARKGGNGA